MKSQKLIFVVVAAICLTAALVMAEPFYYTANESGSITKIDASTNIIAGVMTEGGIVHNVQISPDGKVLGATVIPPMSEMGMESSVSMPGYAAFYDTDNDMLVETVTVGNHPAHIVFTQNGKYVLVTNSDDNNVSVINARTYEVIRTIPTGKGPHGFRISRDSIYAYVANMGEDTFSILNLATFEQERMVEIGETPVTTAVTSDGKTVVITLGADDALAFYDLSDNEASRVSVGDGPVQVFIAPGDRFAFVANQGTSDNPSHTVSKVDIPQKEVVATISVGNGAHGVVTSKDGRFVYVTNMYDNTVSVIDSNSNQVIKTVPVGDSPNGITYKQ